MLAEFDLSDSHLEGLRSPVQIPNLDHPHTVPGQDSGLFSALNGSDLTIAGEIYLHNRSEILDRLGSEFSYLRRRCDAELVLAAYRQWGVQCPESLLGEFAFAIWNHRERRLFCCGDQMGALPFFYVHDRTSFIFSTDIRNILALPRIPRKLNVSKLAATAFAEGLKFCPEDSWHTGIRILLPGTWMLLDREGCRKETYWQPEIRDDLVPTREPEVFEALRELLKQAVECRLAGAKPAALLSGGLDSSSVVSLAARSLAVKNESLPALAVVVSDQLRNSVPDEREFIDEFQGKPGVRIHYVTAPGRGPFDSIENPRRFEVSPLFTSRLFLYEALNDAALGFGADLLLQGDGGELGPTNYGHGWYAELALTGRWTTLLGEMFSSRSEATSAPCRQLARELRDCAVSHRKRSGSLLFREEFIRSSRVASGIAREPRRLPNQRRWQLGRVRDWLAASAARIDTRIALRPRYSYPLIDRRVCEFCTSVPAGYKVRNGYRRFLIRRSLDGILPPRIQWRTSKSPFSPDYYLRYKAQSGKAKEFVASIGAKDPVRSVVDVEALGSLLHRSSISDRDFPALVSVPCTIYLICFLRQFPEFRT